MFGGREEEVYRIHQAIYGFLVIVFVPVFYFTIRKNITIQDSSCSAGLNPAASEYGESVPSQSHVLGAKIKHLSSAAKSLFVVTA